MALYFYGTTHCIRPICDINQTQSIAHIFNTQLPETQAIRWHVYIIFPVVIS